MLIVAVPKSASSALVATLGKLHGLPYVSAAIRSSELARCRVPEAYRQVELFHRREVAEVDDAVVEAVSRPGSIAKLHLPPTENNQQRLAHTRKVILLREPADVIRAYRRGNEAGVFNLHHPGFCFCLSEDAWLRRARETGVLEQLERFVAGWREHRGDKLVLESEELVRSPAESLARVEAYFGLAPSGAKDLARERYTRAQEARPSVPRILWTRRKIILERIARDVGGLLVPSLRLTPARRAPDRLGA